MRGYSLLMIGFIAVANARNMTINRHKRSWQNVGEVFASSVVGAGADTFQKDIIERLRGVQPNECKFSITHKKLPGSASFRTEWEIEGFQVNVNNVNLDGDVRQLHTETSSEILPGPGHLKIVRFHPAGYSCITAVSIACGDQVIKGGGEIAIGFEDMRKAWIREGNERFIEVDWGPPQCVKFHRAGSDNGFKAMDVYPGVFKCLDDRDCTSTDIYPGVYYCNDDRDCIQRSLEVF